MGKTPMSAETRRFIQEKGVVTGEIAGETVLVPVRSGAADLDFIYTSNDTGTTIWECLDGERTVNQIVETICREYDVPAEEATQDVMDFSGALEAAGLVRPAESEE
ncbi:PqqD family protein [Acidobacteria bacterium AH-259-L09]|nr:PqqD family protein [Acidobacteria bacterium AH-259-L09]